MSCLYELLARERKAAKIADMLMVQMPVGPLPAGVSLTWDVAAFVGLLGGASAKLPGRHCPYQIAVTGVAVADSDGDGILDLAGADSGGGIIGVKVLDFGAGKDAESESRRRGMFLRRRGAGVISLIARFAGIRELHRCCRSRSQ